MKKSSFFGFGNVAEIHENLPGLALRSQISIYSLLKAIKDNPVHKTARENTRKKRSARPQIENFPFLSSISIWVLFEE